jgi:hypothetical protein
MTDKPEISPKEPGDKRAMQFYIAAAVLGLAGGIAIGWVLRGGMAEVRVPDRVVPYLGGEGEVKERIVPYGVPCAECAKHAADKVAAASAEMHHPAHLAAVEDE